MKKQFEGDWFIPSYPNNKLPGILTIDEGVIELTLYSLTDFRGQSFIENENEIHRYTIILGETWGDKITLLNSDLLGTNKIGTKLCTFSVAPKTVFEGNHFNSPDEITITSLTCSYSFLTAWMDDLTYDSPLKNQVDTFHDFDSRLYKRTTVEIEDGFNIHIEQFLREHDVTERNSLSFKIHHSVVFVAKSERGFIEFERKAIEFQKLMELGLDCPINAHLAMMNKGETSQKPIFIHRARTYKTISTDSDSYRNHGAMLFSYDKLGENDFKEIMKKWFASFKTYSVVYNIYLDTHQWFKGTGVFLTSVMFNNRVLNIIQGLEHYHRLANEKDDESEEEFKSNLQTILSKLTDSSDHEWLKKRTSPLRKVLRKRLFELLKKYGYMFGELFANSERKMTFVHELSEIRNSLSHGLNTNPDIGIQSYEIYEQSRILLLACILDTLGMTKEKTQELIVQSHEYGPMLRFYRKQRA